MDPDGVTKDERTMRTADGDIIYRVRGSGPTLVLQAPGWGIGSWPYEALVERLAASHTVVTYDPRGSGASSHPRDPSRLNVATFVDDLEALRAHLGLDRFALAGHSHGGLIALRYAMAHPTRVSALVALCAQLVGVHGHADEDPVAELAKDALVARALEELEAAGGFGALGDLRSDEEASAFLHMIAPLYFKDTRHARMLRGGLAAHSLSVRTLVAVSAQDGAFPVADAPRRLRSPTLFVSGRYDMFCPAAGARALASRVPGAQLAVFERSGHFPWLEEPDAFDALVGRFLAATAVAPPQR